jgi:hypothetical protein
MSPVNYNSLEQWERKLIREEYVRHQGGLCHFCKEPLSGSPSKEVSDKSINLKLFPPNFLEWAIHLHHDHDTGMTIGAIHARCNAVLWQYHGE